ncbi:hypothetical protein ACER0A_010320 [Haloimpatiens sp. FM7315]|uniref:hypothetical protein n=1 Tax=Haloimpatiens sp. FM7315 TaxID=3298609 RepID=UPI0035A2CBF9
MKKHVFKKIMSFFIAFMMIFSGININVLCSNKVLAEEIKEQSVNVNDAISVMVNYFNTKYYREKGGKLEGKQYAAMFKASADFSLKSWTVSERIPKIGNYDSLESLGGKADQSLILLEVGKDPSDYENRNLINEIVEGLRETTSAKFIINEMKAMIAVDRFNSKYSDKKVSYDPSKLLKMVISTQKEDGCVDNSVGNTAYAIDLFSKHEDVEGVIEAKKKAVDYLKSSIKENGAIYSKSFYTTNQGEVVKGLLNAGEDVTSDSWTKDGKSIVEGMFKVWDGKIFKRSYGGEDSYTAYTEILSTLGDLKNKGYGEYILKGVKFHNLVNPEKPKEEPKEIGVNVRVRVEGMKETLYDENVSLKDEVYAKDLVKNSIGEKNALGIDSNFLTGIFGEKATNSAGWMYYFIDKDGNIFEPSNMLNKQELKDDKGNYYKEMVWYMAKWNDGITCIPIITVDHKENNYKINVKEQNTMMQIDKRPCKEANVKVEGVGEYKTDENGQVNFRITKGKHKVYVYKNLKDSEDKEYPAIVRQNFTLVGEESETENKIEDIIKDLKKYYDNKELNYLNAMSFNHLNKNEKTQFKLQDSDNAAAVADNIMGIIAIGKNPYNYDNKNFVKKLLDGSKDNGRFVLNINDEDSVTALAESIIALDMAKAKYNVEKSLKELINMANEKKISDVESITKVLMALSKHREARGAKDLIDLGLKNLSEKQLEGGGFDYSEIGNSPYSTAPVIQTLIALGEDPLGEKWSKGGKNPFNALCALKIAGKGFEIAEGMGEEDSTATDLAFAAFTDILKQQSMYWNFEFNVEEPKNYEKIINGEVEDIKSFLKDEAKYGFYAAVNLNLIGIEKEDIAKKIELKSKETNIMFSAMDVMSIVSMGENPRNYKGKDYVKDLLESNKTEKDIDFKECLYSLLALNMVSEKSENINPVLNNLVDNYNKGYASGVAEKALLITALSPYKEKSDIKKIIDNCLSYLKAEQLDNGAFTIDKDMCPKGDSEDTALAIEAIVAAGEDPLSEKWSKKDKNPVDILLSFKMGKAYIYDSSFGAYEQQMYSSIVLRAFLAVKNNCTVFDKLKIKDSAVDDKKLIEIENLTKVKEFKLGREAKISIKAINKDVKDKPVTLVIGIFDENERMLNYVSAKEIIKSGDTVELEGTMKMPQSGKYKVKAFVWDSINEMNPLSEILEIPVK